jgi:hypothetical protein
VFLAIAAVTAAAGAADVASVDDLTLDQLKAINEANRALLSTVVLRETVRECRREYAGEDQAVRERMMRAYRALRDESINLAKRRDASAGEVRGIQARYAARVNSLDDALTVRHVNKQLLVSRASVIDFGLEQARHDDRDLRDLQGLAAQHGLHQSEQRHNLDQTRYHIFTADQSIMLIPAGKLAVVSSAPCFSADLEASRLGIIPRWVLEGDLQLALRVVQRDGKAHVEVTGRERGASTNSVLVRVQPELEYRLTRLVRYDDAGQVLEEFTASDYRALDGVLIPFKTEHRHAAHGFPDYLVRRRMVESVRLNEPVSATQFAIPAGYRVQDTRLARAYH